MNVLTHSLLGLTLIGILSLNIYGIIIGAILPDLDYLIGITHRTIMHSLLFALIISIIAFMKNKKFGISLFIGLLSHILLDLLTTQGVMLLWPFDTFFTFGLFNSMNESMNLLFVLIFLIILFNKDLINYKLQQFKSKKVRIITFSILLVPTLFSIPYTFYQINSCKQISINDLIINAETYDEVCVKTSGVVCSNTNTYTASSGNEYEYFQICENENEITIFLLPSLNPGVNNNDIISVIGTFTNQYYSSMGYEIYMIKDLNIE